MSKRQARISWGVLSAGCLGIALTFSLAVGQNEKPRRAAELLPQHTVLYLGQDGALKHKAAWEQTAAHEAVYESGLVEVIEKIVQFVRDQTGAQESEAYAQAVKHIEEHGLSIAVSVPTADGPPIPAATIVLHEAAEFEPMLATSLGNLGAVLGMRFQQEAVGTRTVTSGIVPQTPDLEIGLWAEGGHLMIAAGRDAVANGIAVASGDAPNLTENPVWRKYQHGQAGFEAVTVAWLDFASLRKTFGPMSIPVRSEQPKSIDDVLKAVGLQNLETLAHQYGYKGRSLWSESTLKTYGPKTGLLSLADGDPIRLEDLPPLPANTSGFQAQRVDGVKLWTTLTAVVREVATFGPAEGAAQVEDLLANLPQVIGFDPTADLLEPLGEVLCVFADPDQGFLGTGMGAVIAVDDAAALRNTIDKLLETATQASRGKLVVHRSKKLGREVLLFEFDGKVQAGSLCVDDNWMIAGLLPQSIEAFLLRLDGKLPVWEPSESQAQALSEVPGEVRSISFGDPRIAWGSLIKLAPVLLAGGQAALKENRIIPPDVQLPITLADIPPAEVVVKPLYPNLMVHTVDDDVIRLIARQSLPGIPFVSGIGEGNSVATGAVLTALLLPAVQQARQAARRTQSKNHLKQLALAMHNYHDVYQSFPSGTHPNEKLKPDERLSWLATVLPFLDQKPLHDEMDFEESWDDEANEEAVNTRLPIFMNPGYTPEEDGPGVTNYIGMAGFGKDAPNLPVTSKRAGIFAYNRKTRIRDIIDGTSNTIMTTEASKDFGPWAAGGAATIRPITKKPYINGPDGIGGPYQGGLNVGMADGSVRFVSENIDPTLFERLSTMADGNVVGDF